MSKYDYNEIFEDGIGRERRMGKTNPTLFIVLLVILIILSTLGN